MAAEAKSVLDSWVRYEGQVKQRQQKELAESIIGKITKELENPRTLQQILNQSVVDVERKSDNEVVIQTLIVIFRDRVIESAIDLLAVIHKLSTAFNQVPTSYNSKRIQSSIVLHILVKGWISERNYSWLCALE